MKIEFTRAEVEQIVLAYANSICPTQTFVSVNGNGYTYLPSTVSVETKEPDAAQ